MMTATYLIPECNLDGLTAELERLNRRCDHLTMPRIEMVTTFDHFDDERKMPYHTVTITGATPHAIVVRLHDGTDLTFEPSGTVARVAQMPGEPVENSLDLVCNGRLLPVYKPSENGAITGLPEPTADTLFIVSGMVADHCRTHFVQRPDVYSPGTGPNDAPIRNDKGQIIAVTRLIRSC